MKLSNIDPRQFVNINNTAIDNSITAKGVCLLLSGIQINDTGGGSRSAQIAIELLRQNYKVIFVNLYPSYEEKQKKLDIKENGNLLELYNIKEFDIEKHFLNKENINNAFCLVEFPHKTFFSLLLKLKTTTQKVRIVYDSIDNWDSTLGGNWYLKEIDKQIKELSDIFIASAKTLQLELMADIKKVVYFIPNAVNTNIFNINNCEEKHELKSDILYAGSLWGNWFDWRIIKHITDRSNYKITFIGGGCPDDKKQYFKDRINFTGIIKQTEIPNYIYNTKVCIIPFIPDNIIKYTNPLKVYEYLSLNKPVVATDMSELYFLPNTYLVKSPDEFLSHCEYCIEDKNINTDLSCFLLKNSWINRVKELLEVVF